MVEVFMMAVFSQLMHKLSVEAPPKILVERYLIEIAKNYNVPYEPDAMVRVRNVHTLLLISCRCRLFGRFCLIRFCVSSRRWERKPIL